MIIIENYIFAGYSVISDQVLTYDDQLVIQSVLYLLTTEQRTIPLRPNFGNKLKKLLFEPLGVGDKYLKRLAEDYIREALRYERRVSLVDIRAEREKENQLTLKMRIIINLTGAQVGLLYKLGDSPVRETKSVD